MTILLTGIDGYMGWPTALKLAKEFPEERIVGIDNFGRRRWVKESGSTSIIPIKTMKERIEAAKEYGFNNIDFIQGDLTDRHIVTKLISKHNPEVILHLAAQPSAPYSNMNGEKANYTQMNNVLGTLNLLWALRDNKLLESHFIETTTTGIYGAPNLNIPEGFIEAIDRKGNRDMLPFPNIASSWYHVMKGFDAVNMWLMNIQTGMPITDVRTSIVYGVDTEETKEDKRLATRFDIDFYFGTLFNRWCAMMIVGHPLTIYGSGRQIKPFISLEDATQSIVNIVKRGNNGEYRVYNQLVEFVRIKDLATELNDAAKKVIGEKPGLNYIPNPRKEKEESEYTFENNKFLEILGNPKNPRMADKLSEIIEKLNKHSDRIKAYKDAFLPKKS
jgi:nucleoside-diphosphate-sugar epimerase